MPEILHEQELQESTNSNPYKFMLSSEQAAILQGMVNATPLVERPKYARIASANHLARRVVYELDKYFVQSEEQQQIHVYDADNEVRLYAIKFIFTNHLGIVSYLLTPIDTTNPRIHLLFRGSKDAPAWCRSTESPAPGYESFYEERYLFLRELHQALENTNIDHLTISGHSLGGSDTQTCATEIMQEMVTIHSKPDQISQYSNLQKLKKLTVNHANSAGVSHNVSTASISAAQYLSKHRLLSINVMCVLTAGDGVQQTGQSHILANVEHSTASVELVKLSSEFEGIVNKKLAAATLVTMPVTSAVAVAYVAIVLYSMYNAHRLRFCDTKEFKEQVFKIYTNATEEGRNKIFEKLNKHPLDNNIASKAMVVLHAFQTYLTQTKRISTTLEEYAMIENSDLNTITEVELQEDPSVMVVQAEPVQEPEAPAKNSLTTKLVNN